LYESFPTIRTTQARSDRMPLPGKAGERWCEVRRIRQVAAIDWGAIGSGTIRTAALNIASKQAMRWPGRTAQDIDSSNRGL